MGYTLWSRGRLVGHTDLDIHTVTSTMRQGFVEPTEEGRALLADATAVWRAIAEVKRGARVRGERTPNDDALVLGAMERREGLDFELRHDDGTVFECEFIRLYDLFDAESGIVDEMSTTEEEDEAEFQVRLSALSGEAREAALAEREQMYAEVEAMVAELRESEEDGTYGSGWPPPPPDDPRWETMQYMLQAHLKGPAWSEEP
jgi:hypothetical protein